MSVLVVGFARIPCICRTSGEVHDDSCCPLDAKQRQSYVASLHSVLIGNCAVNSTDTVLFRLQQQPTSQDSIGTDDRNRVQCITPTMAVKRETCDGKLWSNRTRC